MSEETRFTNENEAGELCQPRLHEPQAAFALLRKGCRHSARAMALRPLRPGHEVLRLPGR